MVTLYLRMEQSAGYTHLKTFIGAGSKKNQTEGKNQRKDLHTFNSVQILSLILTLYLEHPHGAA